MSEDMMRFLAFVIVLGILFLWFRIMNRPRRVSGSTTLSQVRKAKKESKRPKGKPITDFWTQVYDTESTEEAIRIRDKFADLGIQCLLYEQGKKDVYGNALKHYGISVPREHVARAQAVLCETTL